MRIESIRLSIGWAYGREKVSIEGYGIRGGEKYVGCHDKPLFETALSYSR